MTSWATEKIEMLRPGQSLVLSGYNLRLRSVSEVPGPNYEAERGTFEITRNGRPVGQLFSERRFYPVRQQQTTSAGIRTNLISNLYVAIGEPDNSGAWAVRFYYHPLMPWVWIGALTMALGGFVSLCATGGCVSAYRNAFLLMLSPRRSDYENDIRIVRAARVLRNTTCDCRIHDVRPRGDARRSPARSEA